MQIDTMDVYLIYTFLFIFGNTLRTSDCARILLLTPLGAKSHKIFFMGITDALAEKGHHVTIVSAFESSHKNKNIRDVVIPEADIEPLMEDIFEEGGAGALIKNLIFESPKFCSDALGLKEIQDLKKEEFDVIIMSLFFEFCFFALGHHFKAPIIYALPQSTFGVFSEIIGNVEFSSLVPNRLLELTFPQTFLQRFMTVLLNGLISISTLSYMAPRMESICRERGLCPADMPSFNDINSNVSLTIINSVKTLEWPPRPMMPNVIYAGGAHIRPAKKLSQELESWIATSGEEGFIFFSVGSTVTSTSMPERYRKILVNVFGSLKQNVLWKWDEETMQDLPTNVKLAKWLPQQDILGHPKLKLFITHGGLLSTQEATYHGVPLIGMPIFADQFFNMREAANEGWAKLVPWKQLTESLLRDAILETLESRKLKEVSLHRSALMRDRPMEPADEAAFWVEYVIRHKGAHHLISPVFNMSWYELYNMDVWSIIVGVLLCLFYLTYKVVVKALYFCFFRSKNEKKNKKE